MYESRFRATANSPAGSPLAGMAGLCMNGFVEVPTDRLQAPVLQALLEEYASRDGTDYGERELTLEQKVSNLRVQLEQGQLLILYDATSEQWDLLPPERAESLLNN